MNIRKNLFVQLLCSVFIFAIGTILVHAADVDDYEPNDTIQTAYNYDSIPAMTTSVSSPADKFIVGYKTASLTDKDDVDWYRVYCTRGTQQFVDIKNLVAGIGYNVDIYDTTKRIIWSSRLDTSFDSKCEKYYYFTPQKSGYHYMRIYTTKNVQSSNYYFYFGNRTAKFKIKDLSIPGFSLYGSDFRGHVVSWETYLPQGSVLTMLDLSNDTTSGIKGIEKELSTGRRSSIKSNKTSTSIPISRIPITSTITIRGREEKYRACFWIPTVNGEFECDMAPTYR